MVTRGSPKPLLRVRVLLPLPKRASFVRSWLVFFAYMDMKNPPPRMGGGQQVAYTAFTENTSSREQSARFDLEKFNYLDIFLVATNQNEPESKKVYFATY